VLQQGQSALISTSVSGSRRPMTRCARGHGRSCCPRRTSGPATSISRAASWRPHWARYRDALTETDRLDGHDALREFESSDSKFSIALSLLRLTYSTWPYSGAHSDLKIPSVRAGSVSCRARCRVASSLRSVVLYTSYRKLKVFGALILKLEGPACWSPQRLVRCIPDGGRRVTMRFVEAGLRLGWNIPYLHNFIPNQSQDQR
jgi:hypothetical protein